MRVLLVGVDCTLQNVAADSWADCLGSGHEGATVSVLEIISEEIDLRKYCRGRVPTGHSGIGWFRHCPSSGRPRDARGIVAESYRSLSVLFLGDRQEGYFWSWI